MKRFLIVCVLLCGAMARADELADAAKLLDSKAYPQALALYTKLAQQGHPTAQFKLGEMYWYGEAGPIDLAAARGWFVKAADAGDPDAQAALAAMRAHDARIEEITFWTTRYDGAGLAGGLAPCPAPAIPPLSKDNAAIKQVNQDFAAWNTCYGAQRRKLEEFIPPSKRIPADLAALMNQQEYDQAVARVDQAAAKAAAQIGARAQSVMAAHANWMSATKAYVDEQNQLSLREAERNSQRRLDELRSVSVGKSAAPVITK